MTIKIKTISYDSRTRIFWILIGTCLLSLLTYIYAVNATARNIALRQDLEQETRELSANLHSLEFTYIALKNNVTLELAYQYGFREVKNPLYISRTPVALSFNTLNQ